VGFVFLCQVCAGCRTLKTIKLVDVARSYSENKSVEAKRGGGRFLRHCTPLEMFFFIWKHGRH